MLPTGPLRNISPKGRRRRWRLGVASGLAAIVMLTLVVRQGAPMVVRCLVFLPAFVSALGFLQAGRGTCVVHAFRGTGEVDCELASEVRETDQATRAVAWTIVRDALLVGLAAALLAVAPAFRS